MSPASNVPESEASRCGVYAEFTLCTSCTSCTPVTLCGYTMDMVYMDIAWIFYSEREHGKHGKHEHSVRDSSRTIVLGPLVPGTSGTGLYLSYSRPSICNGVLTPCSCPVLPLLPLLPTLSPLSLQTKPCTQRLKSKTKKRTRQRLLFPLIPLGKGKAFCPGRAVMSYVFLAVRPLRGTSKSCFVSFLLPRSSLSALHFLTLAIVLPGTKEMGCLCCVLCAEK